MSLYDKYHSKHNKTYMYNLINGILKKDYNVNMSTNETYNHFFETNFMNTFSSVDTEELQYLNKHLLDAQITYFKEFLSKNDNLVRDEEVKESIEQDYIIHSHQRNINLTNSSRFTYRINNEIKHKTIQVEKVILPIEDLPLFMNPVLIVSLDTTTIELHLRGTMKLGHRKYGLYTPFYESVFQLNSDKYRVQFKNQLYNIRKGCDVYKIVSYKDGKVTIDYPESDFLENDYIRICNFDDITVTNDTCLKQQYKIKQIEEDGFVIDTEDIIPTDLYIMNMSIQHSIHLSYH